MLLQCPMKIINKLLDASIYYSFDKSGFDRHRKSFDKTLSFKRQRNILITGGTSGIGLACASSLSTLEQVIVTGRDIAKADACKNQNVSFKQLDMINWSAFDSFCEHLPVLDSVVFNAGGMPAQMQLNNFGVESQAASQFFGHVYLLKKLVQHHKFSPDAKVIWVTSGGMYLKTLDIDNLIHPTKYNKVSVYANVKRAQVTVLDSLALQYPNLKILAMHPGWVDTPAVRDSIPDFYQKTKHRLRTPEQGADSILWMLSDQAKTHSGCFYFDRQKVLKHLFFFTKKSDKKITQLNQLLDHYYNMMIK